MRLSVCQPLLVFFQLSSLHREDKDREGGGGGLTGLPPKIKYKTPEKFF